MLKDHCVILIANLKYFQNAIKTIYDLRTFGGYDDDIVLITDEDSIKNVDNDFYNIINDCSVIIKKFDNIDLSNILDKIKQRPFQQSIDGRELEKTFQWHKIHVFDIYFKQWKYILYLDSGINIYKPIHHFWEIVKSYEGFSEPRSGIEKPRSFIDVVHADERSSVKSTNDEDITNCANIESFKYKLIAHSDTYPEFKNNYKDQFDSYSYPEIFNELENLIDLTCDNFQSTIMLFNSEIINENVKNDLITYANKFHISRTNEQGIFNIYFNGINKMWQPLPVYWDKTFTYDFWNRDGRNFTDYIMTKYKRYL